MARGVPHSEETKAAVIAALLAGQGVSQTAKQFHVSPNTVKAWRASLGLGIPVVDPEKRAVIDNLVGDLLKAIINSLLIQAEQYSDKAWLKGQEASQVAVLFGVMADKAFRILEAAEQSGEPEDPDLP